MFLCPRPLSQLIVFLMALKLSIFIEEIDSETFE
jgi:hypothetical protein